MACIFVTYPSGHDFDFKYYMEKHMPLLTSKWKSCGLQGWEVIQFESGQDYQIQAILRWDSMESYLSAAASEGGAEVRNDVKNYTTAMPLVTKGAQVGMQKLA